MQRRSTANAPKKQQLSPISNPAGSIGGPAAGQIATATVVRRRFGTGPFDKYWLNVDPCGLICAGFTYWLHLYGCYAVCVVLIPPWMSYETADAVRKKCTRLGILVSTKSFSPWISLPAIFTIDKKLNKWGIFHTIAFCSIALLAIASHFSAMTTDPGSVPPDAQPLVNSLDNIIKEPSRASRGPIRKCRRCNSYKPERAHHCSVCKRCVNKMDHHCPWVNNCVGIHNQKYFLLFVFYTFCSCTYSMTLVIMRFINCIGHIDKHEACLDKPTHLLSLIGLVVESMLFGMFTCCIMLDQWDVVLTKVTHIDRLKGYDLLYQDDGGDSTEGVNEVFGVGRKGKTGFRFDWLSPFSKPYFPEHMKQQILGYCLPVDYSVVNSDEDEADVEITGLVRRTGSNGADIV